MTKWPSAKIWFVYVKRFNFGKFTLVLSSATTNKSGTFLSLHLLKLSQLSRNLLLRIFRTVSNWQKWFTRSWWYFENTTKSSRRFLKVPRLVVCRYLRNKKWKHYVKIVSCRFNRADGLLLLSVIFFCATNAFM